MADKNYTLITCRYTQGEIILHLETNDAHEKFIRLTAETAMQIAASLIDCADKKLQGQALHEFYSFSDPVDEEKH